MTKTRKAVTILAAALMTAALAATLAAFTGCTDNTAKDPGTDTTTPTVPDNGSTDGSTTDGGTAEAKVLYATSFPTDMGSVSFTFYDDNKVDCQSAYTPINGKVEWKYANDAKTEITFEWGEQNSAWTADILSVGDEQVGMYIESESALLPGPYTGFLKGITGAYISSSKLNDKDVVIILREDGTTTVKSYVGTSSKTWEAGKNDEGTNIITLTTDAGAQTGTVKYDDGFIVSMHFDSFFGAENDFTPLTASVA